MLHTFSEAFHIAFCNQVLFPVWLQFFCVSHLSESSHPSQGLSFRLEYAWPGSAVFLCPSMTWTRRHMKSPYGIPEIIAGIFTADIQIWKRNLVVSILSGTVIYMVIIRVIA